jgi:hypothetical protein
MELTQEYLDKKFNEVNQHITDSNEELARIIAKTVAEPMERHFEDIKDLIQMKEKIEQHELEIQRLKQHIKLA